MSKISRKTSARKSPNTSKPEPDPSDWPADEAAYFAAQRFLILGVEDPLPAFNPGATVLTATKRGTRSLRPGERSPFSLPLTRRDLVLFGVGAGTVAVGAGIGLFAAWLAGAFKKKEPRLNED